MKKLVLSLAVLMLWSMAARAEVIERIVAVVNCDVITLYDIEEAMAPELGSIKTAAGKEKAYAEPRTRTTNMLIDSKLLDQAMSRSKIEVTQEDINKQIKAVLDQNHVPLSVLQDQLASHGISFNDYKDRVKQEIRRQKFMNAEIGPKVSVTENDMQNYYREHMSEFEGGLKVHIAQIVLPFTQGMTKEDLQGLMAKAKGIASQARAGSSFAELAKTNSKGPNAETGGDLGIVDPKNLMPQVANTLAQMKVGAVSDPIPSEFGITIVKLIDRPKATSGDFASLKDFIFQKLHSQHMQIEVEKYVQALRKKAYIDIRD